MAAIWYLWPVNNDPATNEYLAKVIGEQNSECEKRDKLCADKVRRNLFLCPAGYLDVGAALAAVGAFNLKLEVFKEDSEGPSAGCIVRYDLWKALVRKASRDSNYLRGHRRHYTPRP
jgi:hypothetical protein